MRIGAFRTFFSNSYGRARRAGLAVASKLREAVGKIDISVGVGDDESSFGGDRARVWLEFVEKTKERLLVLFEQSSFERFPRLEKLVRRFLAKPMRDTPLPPPTEKKKEAPRKLGAHNLGPKQALSSHIERERMALHIREGAGLRDAHRTQKDRKNRSTSDDTPEPDHPYSMD